MALARSFADRQDLGLHVGIILDGNGRWARARGLPRTAGHRRGAEAVKKSREGKSVIPEYQAITDPKLMTTTIGRESTAFREKRAKIQDLIKGLLAKGDNF